MSKSKIMEKIEGIEKITTQEIPAFLSAAAVDPNVYYDKRVSLNSDIIQIIIGGEFVKSKKSEEWKIKFRHRLPNRAELARIVSIMDTFVKEVETPFMNALNASVEEKISDPNDVSIVQSPFIDHHNGIPKIEKINAKKLRNYLFGYEGMDDVASWMLNASDLMQLAAMGEDLRKRSNRNKMLIIGGIAILLTGGAATAVCMHNRRKDDDTLDDLLEDSSADVDVDGGTDIDVNSDEAPVVTID